jgi:anti-sigma regulatory factor (Ser/Thr protein kinase)
MRPPGPTRGVGRTSQGGSRGGGSRCLAGTENHAQNPRNDRRCGSLVIFAGRCFPGEPAAVGRARALVAGALGKRWPGLDEILLMTGEVASNAVRHTASGNGGCFDVAVSVTGDMARVEVIDRGGSSEPRIPEGGGGGALTGGRGLRIVDALADTWGYGGDELGRVVWFEVTGKPDD